MGYELPPAEYDESALLAAPNREEFEADSGPDERSERNDDWIGRVEAAEDATARSEDDSDGALPMVQATGPSAADAAAEEARRVRVNYHRRARGLPLKYSQPRKLPPPLVDQFGEF